MNLEKNYLDLTVKMNDYINTVLQTETEMPSIRLIWPLTDNKAKNVLKRSTRKLYCQY